MTGDSLGEQRFVYDGNAMIAEYNGSGTMLRRYACPELVEGSTARTWMRTIRVNRFFSSSRSRSRRISDGISPAFFFFQLK